MIAQSCLVTEPHLYKLNPGVLSADVCQTGAHQKQVGTQICCDVPNRNAQTLGGETLIAATLGLPTMNTLLFRGFSGDCIKSNSRATGTDMMTIR
jgi:hypothetical protein